MGRYNLAAVKVQTHATQLLSTGRLQAPPAWYQAVSSIPPSEMLTRKPMQKHRSKSRRASRLFQPARLAHTKEERLRWEFFNDHPWELARPRVVLEEDGRDHDRWDWSHPLSRPEPDNENSDVSRQILAAWDAKQVQQAGRPLNGESVVQRQRWLMRYGGLSETAAYDKARKELYSARHAQEIGARVAREEAMFYGGIHGMSLLEVGMSLEDKSYETWRTWAAKEVGKEKQRQASSYSGGAESDVMDVRQDENEIDEILSEVPASEAGQTALGGAMVHP